MIWTLKVFIFLRFYQQKFKESLDFLNQFKTPDLVIELWRRRRIIQCLYENYCADEYRLEALEAKIDAFDKFLLREKKDAKDFVTGFQKFCRLTKKIANGRNLERQPRTELATLLKEELSRETLIARREWLLKKIKAL